MPTNICTAGELVEDSEAPEISSPGEASQEGSPHTFDEPALPASLPKAAIEVDVRRKGSCLEGPGTFLGSTAGAKELARLNEDKTLLAAPNFNPVGDAGACSGSGSLAEPSTSAFEGLRITSPSATW